MKDLLLINLISHYNLPVPTITNWFIETDEIYFEVEDTNAGEILLHYIPGKGMGKFSNPIPLNIIVVNYDKFITSIQSHSFTHGRQRCDILIDSRDYKYFLLGEIKDRSILSGNSRRNVRKGAKDQLLASLQTIVIVPEIVDYLNQKLVKRCCYFNKQSSTPAILSATSAFNRLPNFYPDGFKMSKPDIEAFGFEFYEYTGNQTMQFLN